jgi:DMSO/TMAO reductase YedYZ molybdopterin-dependent catalytic subunit
LFAGVVGRTFNSRQGDVSASRAAVDLPAPAVPAPALPSGTDLMLKDLSPFTTPNKDFYRVDTALVIPQVEADGWSLRVHGMVDHELTITFAQLLERPMIERDITLTCVSNEVGGELAGNAVWTGWPIRELLAMAGPQPGADMVLSTSIDGFTAGTPLEVLTDDREALLVVAMNGEPLPVEHGFPVRMVVPGLYGYVSATKWVVDLKVTTFAADVAYWTPRGWSERGPIKTAARIDVPSSGGQVKLGKVAVAGVAWAQHRGIRAVEVKVDDGPWQRARMAAQPTVDAWRQWVLEWHAPKGNHTLTVRAVDGTGAVQTEHEAPPAPDGASGWHSVNVTVS